MSEHRTLRCIPTRKVPLSASNSCCDCVADAHRCSFKGALNSLTKVAAIELREHRIRVNAINMGWTFTECEDKLQKHEKGENWLVESEAKHAMGRLLRPIDIAATA